MQGVGSTGRVSAKRKPKMNQQYLRDKQVAEILTIGRSSVWRLVKEGKLPAPLKISERVTVWKLSDIEAFIASRMEAIA